MHYCCGVMLAKRRSAVVVPPNLKSTVIVKFGVRVVAARNGQARVQVFLLKAVAVLALHDAHTAEPPIIGHTANGDGHYHLTELAILRNRSAEGRLRNQSLPKAHRGAAPGCLLRAADAAAAASTSAAAPRNMFKSLTKLCNVQRALQAQFFCRRLRRRPPPELSTRAPAGSAASGGRPVWSQRLAPALRAAGSRIHNQASLQPDLAPEPAKKKLPVPPQVALLTWPPAARFDRSAQLCNNSQGPCAPQQEPAP